MGGVGNMKKMVLLCIVLMISGCVFSQKNADNYAFEVVNLLNTSLQIKKSSVQFISDGVACELICFRDSSSSHYDWELKISDSISYLSKQQIYYKADHINKELSIVNVNKKQKKAMLQNVFLAYYTGMTVASMVAGVKAKKSSVRQIDDVLEYKYYNKHYKTYNTVCYNPLTRKIVSYEMSEKKTGQKNNYTLQECKFIATQNSLNKNKYQDYKLIETREESPKIFLFHSL